MSLSTQNNVAVVLDAADARPTAASVPELGTFFKPDGLSRLDILGKDGWATVGVDYGWFSVTDYGAVGDNDPASAAANSVAIQAAIDAIPDAGGVLYFPPGTYYIDSAIVIKSQLTVLGASVQGTTLRQTSTTASIIEGTDLLYVTIQNLLLRGPAAGSGIGIHLIEGVRTANYVSIRNVEILNMGGDAVRADHIIVSTLDTVVANSCGGNGFSFLRGTSTNFISCFAVHCNQAGYYNKQTYSNFFGCASDLNGIGYFLDTCTSISMWGCGTEQCRVIDGTYDGTGVKITGCFSVTLTNIYNLNNAAVGYWITGNSQPVTLTSVREVAPSGASASIRVDAGSLATINSQKVITAMSLATKTTNFPDSAIAVVKSADQFKTANTTLADDSQLGLFVFSTGKYILELEIFYSASTTADIQMAFTGPSGATLSWTIDALDSTAAATSGSILRASAPIGDGGVQIAGGVGSGVNVVAKIQGVLTMGSTSGSVSFRWAQAVSDGGVSTVVRAGSFMSLHRIE